MSRSVIGMLALGLKTPSILTTMAAVCLTASAPAAEHDYYKSLRYTAKLVPGVGLDKVEQEGGADATGYQRRTVQWWPRQGQDIVDIPAGAPLRTWTRNNGKNDQEALAGLCRNWTSSDPATFKAHLIGFRGFGTSTPMKGQPPHIPVAVLRMEDGRPRALTNYGPVTQMVSRDDHEFIHKIWMEAWLKLHATVPPDPRVSRSEESIPEMKPYDAVRPAFNGIEWRQGDKYPQWCETDKWIFFETPHFRIRSLKTARDSGGWVRPEDPARQTLNHKNTFEHIENFWTYVHAMGASMPFWRHEGPKYRYVITATSSGAGGGYGGCGIGGAGLEALSHEFFHGHDWGGWDQNVFGETSCNAGAHCTLPGELQMFSGNFRHPWRNVNVTRYQSSLWCFVLGDNPNWGYGIPVVSASLAGAIEPSAYHTIARLGQQRGLWQNGVKGFGDFFGEYAARMVTLDMVEQDMLRSKHGMPEISYVYPVYGLEKTYRIPNSEAPKTYGFNIIRLMPEEGASEIVVDFHGFQDPKLHSDWRVCIVAVDDRGRARYSPLWNKGRMSFGLQAADRRLWLTVAATPSALCLPGGSQAGSISDYLDGFHAPAYPWQVTLTGCEPGTAHRKQGDVINHDELYTINNGNKYTDFSVKHEVPVPLTDKDGQLARDKLLDMAVRIKASSAAFQELVKAGRYDEKGWWEMRKTETLGDLARRVEFLQKNAMGHRHANGGGFVADNARVAASAYVGPHAMVLDGAQVKDQACIKEFAVVMGDKTVVSGNAKIGGKAWVCGDLKIGGNARILESATIVTLGRKRWSIINGAAEITGSVVIKGDPYVNLSNTKDLILTGGLVADYGATLKSTQPGTFSVGRFCVGAEVSQGVDDGALYANWEFDQAQTFLLEDSYVNNNGILYGSPQFTTGDGRKHIVFNGVNQYGEAPPSVADFGALTIDMHINRSGPGKDQRLFDFGTGAEECFYLATTGENGKLVLIAKHGGKSHTLDSSAVVPPDKWVAVRVAMDGSNASITIDGKQVANGKFEFSPREVFIGDRPEGNFIACARNLTGFFQGKMDHFRIYRKVHEDFNALGRVPFALTQSVGKESVEQAKEASAAWDEWSKKKTTELNKTLGHDAYGEKIKALEERKKQTESKEQIAQMDAELKKLAEERHQIWWQVRRAVGGNPFSSLVEADNIRALQENRKYHTTADWDGRTREEVAGQVTPEMKEWLLRVRGF